MKIKFISLFAFMFIVSGLYSAGNKYKIINLEKDDIVKLQISRDFFINNIYLDFIAPFGLDDHLSMDDVTAILDELYRDVSAGTRKTLVIPVKDGRELTVHFKSYPVKDRMSLLVTTNYDMESRELVPPDGDFSKCYSKQYFIINNSLVPGYIFYMEDRDAQTAKFRESGDYNALADFYLFDDNSGNDSEIPGIIAKGLKSSSDKYQLCLLRFTEAQYYLFRGKYGEASASVTAAEKLSGGISDARQKKFIEVSVRLMRNIISIVQKGTGK